ncbi:hypothetical protein K0038_04424 [Pseudomonas syringae]|nr:hypothetical protein [Pseudomonas syringae]
MTKCKNIRNEREPARSQARDPNKFVEIHTMLKFLGSTVGIIFLIGLVVVIALFKLVF